MPAPLEHRICFMARQFSIEPDEDSETNPLCYGQSVAEWLRLNLAGIGYSTVEEVIPEDWGWCVMCQRDPFALWIGCVNIHDYSKAVPEGAVPLGSDVTWSCFVVAEVSLTRRLFKKPDTAPAVERLFEQVKALLSAQPDVAFVDCP